MIGQAWRTTWRNKFLWFFGLFVGSTASTCSGSSGNVGGGSGGSGGVGNPFDNPNVSQAMVSALGWIQSNLGTIIAVAGLLFLIGLIFWIISFIAQGGMATATARLAQGESVSFGQAWSKGTQLFWRYFGLFWIVFGMVLAILLFVGIVGLLLFVGGRTVSPNEFPNVLMAVGIILLILFILAMIVFGIFFGIIQEFATRAIAVEDIGPVAALKRGYALLRQNLSKSLLTWLVGIGLALGAVIAITIIVVIALIPLGLLGWVVYLATQALIPTLVYAGVALLVFIAFSWLLGAIMNTFFWNYWTLAYLKLTGLSGPPDNLAQEKQPTV